MRTIAEADLHAVVGSVDAAAFGESSIASMLGDLADIEPIGRAHHEVVATIAADSPVVPLRLATIYPDDETVGALLAEHHAELTELLESLRGTQEWGVQVYLRPAVGAAVPAGVTVGGDGGGSTGPHQPWLEAEASANQVDRVLSDIAIVSRRQPAPYLRPGSVCGWMVLNGIYLLDADRAAGSPRSRGSSPPSTARCGWRSPARGRPTRSSTGTTSDLRGAGRPGRRGRPGGLTGRRR